jgi:hypothetical protein
MIVCLSIIAILCSVIVALSVVNYRLRSQVSFSKEILHFPNYVSAVSDTSWSETKLKLKWQMTRLSNDMMKYYDQVIHEKDSIILINYKK